MAKEPRTKRKRGEGRTGQMWQVFQMTRRSDKAAAWLMLAAFIAPVIALSAVGA